MHEQRKVRGRINVVIRKGAGPELVAALADYKVLESEEILVTEPYNLNAKIIIHVAILTCVKTKSDMKKRHDVLRGLYKSIVETAVNYWDPDVSSVARILCPVLRISKYRWAMDAGAYSTLLGIRMAFEDSNNDEIPFDILLVVPLAEDMLNITPVIYIVFPSIETRAIKFPVYTNRTRFVEDTIRDNVTHGRAVVARPLVTDKPSPAKKKKKGSKTKNAADPIISETGKTSKTAPLLKNSVVVKEPTIETLHPTTELSSVKEPKDNTNNLGSIPPPADGELPNNPDSEPDTSNLLPPRTPSKSKARKFWLAAAERISRLENQARHIEVDESDEEDLLRRMKPPADTAEKSSIAEVTIRKKRIASYSDLSKAVKRVKLSNEILEEALELAIIDASKVLDDVPDNTTRINSLDPLVDSSTISKERVESPIPGPSTDLNPPPVFPLITLTMPTITTTLSHTSPEGTNAIALDGEVSR
ncbi:hypothetical protein EJ05DRAFT_524819 [Pseudovirgaria hyperparasitica]|uniref:Macro domain-containing protein n=1 Tax=Pseudovirgaria hyperparasitica TaxID=470096 RepID=A0A6A6WF87_9PEZI|nr:uncharacterized protein EJ05DRAFT_524819 [Pseudovirgaria hyperparasitica]KAF2761488.1 hypothetical protein EJ05DRAFT_524819 [Pseudovirgaria hyperparasitica]